MDNREGFTFRKGKESMGRVPIENSGVGEVVPLELERWEGVSRLYTRKQG